jgi:putative intracellular protease/amidase
MMDSSRPGLLAAALLMIVPAMLLTAGCAPAGDPGEEPALDSSLPAADAAEPASAPAAAREVPWPRLARPALPADRPLAVAFLAVDGVYNSELMAPYDIFHHTRFHAPPGMEVFVVSPDGEPVTTFEGLTIGAHYSYATAPPIDVLVVPSAEGSMEADLKDAAMIAWVRERGQAARYVMSLCDGAFVLAQAGLLDGLAVTTFPGDQDRFAQMFPQLDLRRGPSFVHDGKAITSNGGARSYDPAMYLVDLLYGSEAARGVARGMVIDWPPTAAALDGLVIEDSNPDTQTPAHGAE